MKPRGAPHSGKRLREALSTSNLISAQFSLRLASVPPRQPAASRQRGLWLAGTSDSRLHTPGAFHPLTEETGLIGPGGLGILGKLSPVAVLQDQGIEVRVAVNLSASSCATRPPSVV